MKGILTAFTILFVFIQTYAQTTIKGLVTDTAGEALPFVNVRVQGAENEGTISDIDGRFVLKSERNISRLIFSYVGYQTQTVPIISSSDQLMVQLIQSSVSIQIIEIVAGENPAHRIIRRAVQMREVNNPERMESYACHTYNKMIFDFVPDKKEIASYREKNEKREASGKKAFKEMRQRQYNKMNRLDSLTAQQHLFLMESITQRIFKAPKSVNETITHNRVSGFREPSFAALANAIQPFSFYQDHLEILDKDYLNPISPGSTRAYFFKLEDTLYQGVDSIYVLSYRPRKGINFDGLKGLLYIHTSTYAIQNVIAQPAVPIFIDLKIEQQYQFVNGEQWFPRALNFELLAKNYPSKLIGLQVSGRSYIDSVNINPDLSQTKFHRDAWTMEDDAFERNDSIWKTLRHVPLTEKEIQTYVIVDSLGMKKHFDELLNLSEALVSGRYPLGKVDFLMHHLLSFNAYENVRVGGGLSTNEKWSKFIELEAYGGYGIKDKGWKYGGAIHLNFLDDDRLRFDIGYSKDLKEPAALFSSTNELFSNRFYADRMSEVEEKRLALNGRAFSFLQAELALSQSVWQPDFDYLYEQKDQPQNEFAFTEIQFNARYAFGEQTLQFLGARVADKTRFPVLSVAYVKGLDGILDGAFDYQRMSVAVDHSFLLRRFGNSTYRIEAGWLDGEVPYNRLFVSNTFSNDSWFELLDNTFQTMEPYEFLSDRFVHFFFRHDFKSLLLRTKKFQPRIALIHNMGIGQLQLPEPHKELEVKTMEKGYFESGIRIGNIIRIPYLNIAYIGLGAGVYHRYGPYALDSFWDNTTVNLAIDFTF